MRTHYAHTWLHLMFLRVQAHQEHDMLGQDDGDVAKLKHCWHELTASRRRASTFATAVTCAFPDVKQRRQLGKELRNYGVLDALGRIETDWRCFACAQPDRVHAFVGSNDTEAPVLEGRLKEKTRRWRLFKRWQTKYFTLSTAALTYRDDMYDADVS